MIFLHELNTLPIPYLGQLETTFKNQITKPTNPLILEPTAQILKPVVFYDTIVGSEDSILFGSEYDSFFKKVSAECNPKTPAAWPVEWSATREDYEYEGNAPTDVHNFWMKTVATIHAHFPKPSAEDLAAGEMYLVSDPVWQEKYFDISSDKLTMRDGHAAYAQKHLLGNMQTYLNEELKAIVNKANQYIKGYVQNNTATQYVNYDKLFVTFDEPTEQEEKVDKNMFTFVKKCIQAGNPNYPGCTAHITGDTEKERETDKVADRQARLFLLNLMLVDLPTMRNFTYETLLFGNHEREEGIRERLAWSFHLRDCKKEMEKNESEKQNGSEDDSKSQGSVFTQQVKHKMQAQMLAFSKKKQKLDGGLAGHAFSSEVSDTNPAPGVHIQNINEVHFHMQNEVANPDLSAFHNANKAVEGLIQKEKVIFDTLEQLEPVLDFLKHNANNSTNCDEESSGVTGGSNVMVEKVSTGIKLLQTLRYKLQCDDGAIPHANEAQKGSEFRTRLQHETIVAFKRGRKLLLKEYASTPVQKERKLCGYTIKQDLERPLPKVVVDKTWKHHFCMLCSALHSIDLVSTEIIVANRKEMKSTAAQKLKHALDFFREAIMRE